MRVKLAGMFEKQKSAGQGGRGVRPGGQGYPARKDNESAAKLLVRAFKLSPANPEARRLLADFYAQRQDWQVVVGLLETPVARGSQDVDLLVLYGEALTRVNHAREAAGAACGLQEREPNAVPVNLALGRALPQGGRGREGDRGPQPLRRRAPGGEPARAGRAAVAGDGGGRPRGRPVLQRILEVAQKRGDAAGRRRRVPEARRDLREEGTRPQRDRRARAVLEARPGDAAATAQLERLQRAPPSRRSRRPRRPPAAAAGARPAAASADAHVRPRPG